MTMKNCVPFVFYLGILAKTIEELYCQPVGFDKFTKHTSNSIFGYVKVLGDKLINH